MFNNQIPFQTNQFYQQQQQHQQYQFQFQQITTNNSSSGNINSNINNNLINKPKWSLNNLNNETDDHFNRHIENLSENDHHDLLNEEEHEELNEQKLTKLISNLKNKKKFIETDLKGQNEVEEDDEDETNIKDEPKVFQDEEELDLIASENTNPILLTKTLNKPSNSPKPQFVAQVKPQTSSFNVPQDKTTSVMPTPLAYSRSSSLTSLNSFDVKSIHSSVASEYSHVPVKVKNKIDNLELENSQYLDDEESIDGLMPDSPAAPDTSFLKAQRIKHKLNQIEYRQSVAAAGPIGGTVLPINTKPQEQIIQQQTTSKPWQTNDLNSIMSRLNLNKTKLTNDIKEEQFSLPTQSIYQCNNTPPIKLVNPTPKFVNHNLTQQVQQPVMSVTYAFMKNTQTNNFIQPQLTITQQQHQQQQSQPIAPPKFLLNHHQHQIKYQPTHQIQQNNFIPQSPIQNGYLSPCEDTPCVYSVENKSRILNNNHINNNNNNNYQTSPQESICSRMSDASIPSLIRQDISKSNVKFNNLLNSNTGLVNLNPNFKALIQKLSVNKQEQNETSSSSSASSCSSVIPKIIENNFNQVNRDQEEEDLDENDESINQLNLTTKPMNTPAGFASMSGASLIDVETDNEDNEENRDSLKENDSKQNQNSPSLYIDFDLENFIKENFQPSTKSINTSLDENEIIRYNSNNSKDKFQKRASLQSLDLSNLQTNKQKLIIQQKPAKNLVNKQVSRKRLSEDNSSNIKPKLKLNDTSNRPNRTSSQSIQQSVSNICTSKTVLNKPLVTMTKTAQLRASKLNQQQQQIKQDLTKKPLVQTNSKLISISKPAVNKNLKKPLKQDSDKLNQTINMNEQSNDVKSEPVGGYHLHLQHLNSSNQTRRKSFSFGSSTQTISVKKDSNINCNVNKNKINISTSQTGRQNLAGVTIINQSKPTLVNNNTKSVSSVNKNNVNSNFKFLNSKLSNKAS